MIRGEFTLSEAEGSPTRGAIRCEKGDHHTLTPFSYSWPTANRFLRGSPFRIEWP
jgi:hypothetical protein